MEGDGEGGGATGPSAEWAGPLRPHTLWTASRGTAAAPVEPAPPATRGRWRRGAPADRSLRPGAPRRRVACAAGSDGSGSCHVEGGWGGDGGVGDENEVRNPGSGVLAGRVQAWLLGSWLRAGRWPGDRFSRWLCAVSVISARSWYVTLGA